VSYTKGFNDRKHNNNICQSTAKEKVLVSGSGLCSITGADNMTEHFFINRPVLYATLLAVRLAWMTKELTNLTCC